MNVDVRQIDMPNGGSLSHRLMYLKELERKVLWLATWMIHNANHLRESRDGLKVGGHQASSASVVTLMTALYFDVLRPQDRVAVKPHASPVFHAIQYLLGNQSREALERFRAYGGAQAYPSRIKDRDDVDFSTGSVGLGVALTVFASLVQDYVRMKGLAPASPFNDEPAGRMIALAGDAELDEGNVFEALFEGWKHDVRNVWWIIDYNRQSLDAFVSDRLFQQITQLFETLGWRVVVMKYGKMLQEAFGRPGGQALRDWIDTCPNSLYSALVFKGHGAWRERLLVDIGDRPEVQALVARYDDAELHALMTNLAGHDMATVLETLHGIRDDRPTCFLAYTIKGYGLPLAGHKDNHAGIMTPDQMAEFKRSMAIEDGREWDRFTGLQCSAEELQQFLAEVPFNRSRERRQKAEPIAVPTRLPVPSGSLMSTQEGLGKILSEVGRGSDPLSDRIVTTSPDVTISTNLGGWVNRRGVFHRRQRQDTFSEQKVVSAYRWAMSYRGQHIELGIAENNLFLLAAALGLSHQLFGARLLPIATLYDPFIQRGLDALNYACYQDARFILVGTPSGITLGPEGGAHQSISTPMIGMAQDGLTAFEPAFVDELAAILRWSLEYIQRDGGQHDGMAAEQGWHRDTTGGSVYLRLSTRPLKQPGRQLTDDLVQDIIAGGYWLKAPQEGAELAIVYSGAVASEAISAHAAILEDLPGAGLLAVTSADRLHAGWQAASEARRKGLSTVHSMVEALLAPLAPNARLVTVLDGHPATLSWLGAVCGHKVHSLGVEHFGQSGDLIDLYRHYRIDAEAIVDACAAALLL